MLKLGSVSFIALIAAASLSGGCVSQYRRALEERDMRIQKLEEERTELKAALQESQGRERLAGATSRDPFTQAVTPTPTSFDRTGTDDELAYTQDQLRNTGVESERRNGRIVLTLPGEITFPSGQAVLSEQGKGVLRQVSRLLKDQYGNRIIWVEGHTDNQPIRKSGFQSNRHLSFERAQAVVKFLTAEAGLDESRLVVAAHGEYAPVADNSTDDGRKRNRRVELIIGD